MQKTNRDFPFIANSEVIEWDIKAANVSIMEYYHLVDQELIIKFRALRKDQREIAVGKLMKRTPDFSKALESGFNKIIEEFMDINQLTWDDIVSVKRDAVFVKNKAIKHHTFGSNGEVVFVPKNTYKHVLLLPRYEVYLTDTTTDVKGISDTALPLHDAGMIYFIRNTMYSASNFVVMHKFFKEYVDAYKKKELDFDAYREFTSDSTFHLIIDGHEMRVDEVEEDELPYLNILYNYEHVIMPTIRATI